jgi:hypothetical protein
MSEQQKSIKIHLKQTGHNKSTHIKLTNFPQSLKVKLHLSPDTGCLGNLWQVLMVLHLILTVHVTGQKNIGSTNYKSNVYATIFKSERLFSHLCTFFTVEAFGIIILSYTSP